MRISVAGGLVDFGSWPNYFNNFWLNKYFFKEMNFNVCAYIFLRDLRQVIHVRFEN